jgi:branched-chain amino acid transport system permease protein
MTTSLLIAQLLNGLQYGVLLFLLAAGLTLVFGIMSFVNLAHGSLYMLGAYAFAVVGAQTDSFLLGVLAAVLTGVVVGFVLEIVTISKLYQRDHLDHVLATFGLVMFFNEVVRMIWGPQALCKTPSSSCMAPLRSSSASIMSSQVLRLWPWPEGSCLIGSCEGEITMRYR